MLQVLVVGLNQTAFGIKAKAAAFVVQNIGTEFLGHVGFAVLVDSHELVHTIDGKLYVHHEFTIVRDDLWIHLENIIVLGDEDFFINYDA